MWNIVMLKLSRYLKRVVRDEKGMSLIEAILMIIILGITVVPLSTLSTNNVKFGTKTLLMTEGCLYAQSVMEQIYADYFSPDTSIGGYDKIVSRWGGATTPDPPTGYSGLVTISAPDSSYGVTYSNVTVTVSSSEIPDVVLYSRIIQ